MEITEPEVMRTAARDIVTDAMTVPSGSFSDLLMTKAKLCLLDYLSCAFEASSLPWSQQAVALATPTTQGAHIIGRDILCPLGDAGFANAVAGHGLVREDMHPASVAHLGVVVWPTVLALAEKRFVSGRQALGAAIVGYEVGARIGRAVMTTELARLFRPTGLVGPFAAAIAGARIAGLSIEQALSAFALAGNCSAGLNEWPHTGGSEMYFHPGFVVKNALACLDLAQHGALASPTILEGEAGFFQAYGRTSMARPVVLFPEGGAEILSVFNKAVPACNFAQSPCQAALNAMGQIEGDSRRITAIRIDTTLAAIRYPGCSAKGPFNYALQAKMSIPFGVAATLASGAIEEKNYSNLHHAEIDRLMSVTTLASDGPYTAAFPGRQGARITLLLDNGDSVTGALDDVVAADSDLIHRRFTEAASTVVGAQRAKQIETVVDQWDTQTDAGELARLCAA